MSFKIIFVWEEKQSMDGFQPAWKIKANLSLSLTEHHAMKAYQGSGGIAPRIP
jgi:hypothetical protein